MQLIRLRPPAVRCRCPRARRGHKPVSIIFVIIVDEEAEAWQQAVCQRQNRGHRGDIRYIQVCYDVAEFMIRLGFQKRPWHEQGASEAVGLGLLLGDPHR